MDFLTLILGWMSGIVGVNLLSQSGTVQKPNNIFLCDGRSIPDLKPVLSYLKLWEAWHPYGKDIEGKGKFTTGWGSMNLLAPDGTVLRPVKKGEVWSKQVADLQLEYYVKNSARKLNRYLVSSGYAVNNKLYYAFLQAAYNIGDDFFNFPTFKTIVSSCRGNLDLTFCAETYKSYMLRMYKTYSGYPKFGLGWSRRILGAYYLTKGIEKSRAIIERELKKAY